MYVITSKAGVIMKISPTIGYQENGNPLVDHDTLAIAEILVGEVSGDIEVPEGTGEYTHTWINGTFGENPQYVRPEPEPTIENLLLEFMADHEYRLCLMELGITEV